MHSTNSKKVAQQKINKAPIGAFLLYPERKKARQLASHLQQYHNKSNNIRSSYLPTINITFDFNLANLFLYYINLN